MAVSDARDSGAEADADTLATTVSAHRSSPDRVVFTEEGNTDGWISTDLTVALDR